MSAAARALLACLALTGMSGSLGAAAHDLPRAASVAFHPNDPDRIAVFAGIGVLLSNDGGRRFELLCGAKLGLFAFESPALRFARDGDLLVGGQTGLSRGSRDGCSFRAADPALASVRVRDLVADPLDFDASYLVIAAAASEEDAGSAESSHLLRSLDDGQSWQTLRSFGPESALEQVRVGPSDPRQIYLTIARVSPDGQTAEYRLARSRDGGATFSERVVPLEGEDRELRVLYLSPRDPERLLAMTTSYSRSDPRMHRILQSDDGGASFREVMRLTALSGVASDPGSGRLWLADFNGDLHRSDDDGATFERLETRLHLGCLAYAHGRLWACADEWLDGFALGYSEDAGAQFTGVLRWQDVPSLIQCGAAAQIEPICGQDWWHLQQDLDEVRRAVSDSVDGGTPSDAGKVDGLDAGRAAPNPSSSGSDGTGRAAGGCGCRVGALTAERSESWGFLATVALALLARRRARPRSAPTTRTISTACAAMHNSATEFRGCFVDLVSRAPTVSWVRSRRRRVRMSNGQVMRARHR